MATKKDKATDMFMNFRSLAVDTLADPTALQESKLLTGMSIRGALIWLIHLVEFGGDDLGWSAASNAQRLVLSTRGDLATIPQLPDSGFVSGYTVRNMVGVAEIALHDEMGAAEKHYLPPIPIAAPVISLYHQADVNDGSIRNRECWARLGFTTAPLDAQAYTEIAETWGW